MVKVKGQVCEIAMCLRDEEVRIRDMARLLFHELSKRSNNPIYNLLPEIVSRLSSMSVKKEDFRAIMAFLLNFIKKERQVEMLVDKLCQRFPKSTSISQKANIAYCLANVKCNEKCIKILNDHFNLYKDALFDEDVLKNFMSIALKSKKFAKPELKQAIEEWEEKLKQQSDTGLEDEEAKKKAEKAKKRVQRRKNQKKKIEVESSEEEDEVSEGDEEEELSEEEEEEMEFDDENTEDAAPSKSKEATPAKHQRRGRRQVLQNVN
jgi:condensin complex subunit 1